MSTSVLAAGWTTSSSLRIVAPSFEMVALPFACGLVVSFVSSSSAWKTHVDDELVHPPWAERRRNGLRDGEAGVDVGQELGCAL